MATYNLTSSDEDSSLHQISSSANVSIGQSDHAFTLPGIALKATANCNINDSICNSVLGGDIMSLPGMENLVVSVSSSGQSMDGGSSHNANARVNANYKKGHTFDINASSSASTSSRTESKKMKDVSSRINHGCTNGTTSQDNKQTKNAQSSVNIAINPNKVSPCGPNSNSQIGGMHLSANSTVDSTHEEPSCSSNAEVILRPENAPRSRQRSIAWQRTMNSKLVKNVTRLSLGHLTRTYYAPLLQKMSVKVRYVIYDIVLYCPYRGFKGGFNGNVITKLQCIGSCTKCLGCATSCATKLIDLCYIALKTNNFKKGYFSIREISVYKYFI